MNNIMNTINENVFDKNLFIILGSNQNLKIKDVYKRQLSNSSIGRNTMQQVLFSELLFKEESYIQKIPV